MQVTVTLYSSRQDILETKQVRFEWSGSSKGDKLPVTIAPDSASLTVADAGATVQAILACLYHSTVLAKPSFRSV